MNICTKSIISGGNCGLICNRKLSEDGFCRYHGKQSSDICSICYNIVSICDYSKSGIHILNCGHTMHGKCYEDMLFKCENALFCPLCKKQQSSCSIKEEIATLHAEVRDLEITLENVQNTLNEVEEETTTYQNRYRRWKKKHEDLRLEYNGLIQEFNDQEEILQQKQLEYNCKQKQFNDLKNLYNRKNTKLKKLQQQIISIISPNVNNQQ